MGLGDILGSISPLYGAASGNGLGGLMRYLSPLFLLSQLGHHGADGSQQPGGPGQALMQQAMQANPNANFLGRLGGG